MGNGYARLTLTERKTGELMEKVFHKSLTAMDKYLSRPSDKALNQTKVALGVMGVYSRLKQTDRVKDATQLGALQVVAEDKKQLAEYVRATMPHLVPMKGSLLQKPKKNS